MTEAPQDSGEEPEIRVSEEDGVLRVTVRGRAGVRHFREAHARVISGGTFDHPSRLWDLRDARLDLSSEELRSLAQEATERDASGVSARVALLVSDDVSYGIGRVQQAYRETRETELGVFRSEAEALAWLRRLDSTESESDD